MGRKEWVLCDSQLSPSDIQIEDSHVDQWMTVVLPSRENPYFCFSSKGRVKGL